MQHLLVVDDEEANRSKLCRLLQRNGYQVSEAGSVQEAESSYQLSSFDLILSDLRLPGAPGTDLIQKAKKVPVLIMTSNASLRSAVESMRMGAVDFVTKPFDQDGMLATVQRNINQHQNRKTGPGADPGTGPQSAKPGQHGSLIGNCAEMEVLYSHIDKVAPTDTTVLILGETGTGKELVAQTLHRQSRRQGKVMITVNCAAIPETLIESELFGYEKGAFTGASTNRKGLIEAAHGGTLFLDEIGELPVEAQARLLRFIQEGEIRRIGAVTSRKVDVRLICATHRNLQELAEVGKFRQDLFYRINVMRLQIPPLRERGKDILTLAKHLLAHFSARHDRGKTRFSAKASQAISAYPWPGNVREMENAIERAVVLSEAEEIDIEVLGIGRGPGTVSPLHPISAVDSVGDATEEADSDPSEGLSLEDYFHRFVLENQDSMSETELAQKLGVSRKCLWERRQRFGIPRQRSGKSAGKKRA